MFSSVTSSRAVRLLSVSAVVAYSLFNFFYKLDTESFYTDEVTYALSGMEYLEGNFTRNWEHPFLGKVLIGLSLKLFGKSDFSARLPCALFGFLTGIVLYLFAKELTNSRYGLLALVLWSTSPIILWVSRRAILDAFLIFFFTLSLYMFWRFFEGEKASDALLGGLSLGLALACKVTASIVVPILAVYSGVLIITDKQVPKLAFWGKLAIALLLALSVFFLAYMPVLDNLSPILQSMNQHWSSEQRYGHRAVIGNVIYDKQPWWTYLYWYWRGYPPYLLAYGQGLLVLLGIAICFALFQRKRDEVFLLISLLLPFGYLSFYLSYKMFRYAGIFEPSIVILACSFIFSASSYLKSRRRHVYLSLMGLLAIAVIYPMIITSWRTLGQEENEYKAVANYLTSKIQGDEVVFVWGYTDAMEWYLEDKAEIVGGYTTNHFEGRYDADYFVVDPRMSSRWPDDPLNTYLRENGQIYSQYHIGGLELYVREGRIT
jgi:4-amino-4-deoxy-L-arabinose transferase-like glycosyltransferase